MPEDKLKIVGDVMQYLVKFDKVNWKAPPKF